MRLRVNGPIMLGAPKYAEFEVERGQSIEHLVYPDTSANRMERYTGECLSGQKELAVNEPAMPSQVRILPPPSSQQPADADSETSAPLRFQRTRISEKHQITIPSVPFRGAGLQVGDRLHGHADGPGRVILERVGGAWADRRTLARFAEHLRLG